MATRLLQNPLGDVATPGEPGDLVCVTDGTSKIYLTSAEFAAATDAELRWLLAERPFQR